MSQPLSVVHVPVPNLDTVWPLVSGFLERGMKCAHGEITLDQLRLLVVQGAAFLLAVGRDKPVGAVVVEIKNYPNFRAMNVIAIGGKGMFADNTGFDALARFARSLGASAIEGYCPESVARLWAKFNFERTYVFVRRKL